eukprot:1958727-Pyramimonas_sp.AAC.1
MGLASSTPARSSFRKRSGEELATTSVSSAPTAPAVAANRSQHAYGAGFTCHAAHVISFFVDEQQATRSGRISPG